MDDAPHRVEKLHPVRGTFMFERKWGRTIQLANLHWRRPPVSVRLCGSAVPSYPVFCTPAATPFTVMSIKRLIWRSILPAEPLVPSDARSARKARN